MGISDAEYLTAEREADLLAAILIGIDGTGSGTEPRRESLRRETDDADRILCDLIELGLSHPDAGPATYQHWSTMTPDAFTEDDELRAELIAIYLEKAGD